jgi:hypothetical protein
LGRDFFLIQGSGGDIVHFEQSMTLVKSLVEANVLFRQQVTNVLGNLGCCNALDFFDVAAVVFYVVLLF